MKDTIEKMAEIVQSIANSGVCYSGEKECFVYTPSKTYSKDKIDELLTAYQTEKEEYNFQRVLDDRAEKMTDGCTCQKCGRKYRIDLNIPDILWNRIRPKGKAEGAGLLCGSCIMNRLEELEEFLVFAVYKSGAWIAAQWQPIETAPKDKAVLLYALGADNRPMRVIARWMCPNHMFDSSVQKCDCECYEWIGVMGTRYDVVFTHWMPIPKGPKRMEKRWKPLPDTWGDQCPYCGDDLEVFTDSPDDSLYDGDPVRCVTCKCPGQASVDDDSGYIAMHDEPDCDCDWCKAHPAN